MNFSIKTSKNNLPTYKTSIDHVFIEYENKTVHLAILHKYNSYYLIQENTHPLSNDIHLSYGDTLRAVEQ